jgi:catechol 2,3-dioxygenase-like lactoylglutathione lyase family enzyme
MPKLRHIALAAEDPFAAADFYKEAFGFTEVSRTEKSDDPKKSYGVFLSDGTLSLAVLHFGWDQGPGLDFRGVHHFGVLVEDVEKITGKIEELGAKCFAKRPEGHKGFYETKFYGPDKVIFDIADHPWRGSAPLEAK